MTDGSARRSPGKSLKNTFVNMKQRQETEKAERGEDRSGMGQLKS